MPYVVLYFCILQYAYQYSGTLENLFGRNATT